MKTIMAWTRFLGSTAVVLAWLCGPSFAGTLPSNGEKASAPIQPISVNSGLDKRKVLLGDKLFHDPRLSGDDAVSCANCHDLATGGGDGLARSVGIGGKKGGINAPTVYNAGFNVAQFWDGRAATLEEQAAEPVHNPLEMGSDWPQVIGKLKKDPEYVAAFGRIYDGNISGETIVDAIATFERSLTTPDSPFDRYLQGERQAITEEQKEGYGLFRSYGCVVCHQGVNVGGNVFHRMGAVADYFADRGGEITPDDLGRYNVTGQEADRHVFKVPSLRVVRHTAPYFHDGSAETLEEAVSIMARYQLGLAISGEDIRRIISFLHSLEGRHERLVE